MYTFRKAQISDKAWVDKILKSFRPPSMEYNFTTIFIWQDIYETTIKKYNDCLLVRFGEDGGKYLFPVGGNGVKDAVDWILSEHEGDVRFAGLCGEQKIFLEKNYPERFEFIETRDMGDYIYTVEQLSTLKGKKLSSKRNHINRFVENNPDWEYVPITAENIGEAEAMHDEWIKQREPENKSGLYEEGLAVKKAFKYFNELGLTGGILRANGKVIAFSIGDELNDDTFLVHIEKAFADIQGAYPMINKQFVLANCQNYQFVDREEDTGDEGLRKAKLSYNPHEIVKKYYAKEIKK